MPKNQPSPSTKAVPELGKKHKNHIQNQIITCNPNLLSRTTPTNSIRWQNPPPERHSGRPENEKSDLPYGHRTD
jgi:hypothetical protein